VQGDISEDDKAVMEAFVREFKPEKDDEDLS
jgi:hypothetical protein